MTGAALTFGSIFERRASGGFAAGFASGADAPGAMEAGAGVDAGERYIDSARVGSYVLLAVDGEREFVL